MPIYSVQGPDGRIYDIEGPEGASDAQVVGALRNHLASLPPPEETPKPKTGIGAAVSKGIESLISSGRTAFGAATGDADEAARAGLERGEAMGKKYADQVSLQKVKDAYNKDGVLSAAGEALSQIPAAIAEQAPNLAAMAGSARLGAMAGAPFGPVGATIGGIGGALIPALAQQFSGNIERQAQEGVPVSSGRALAAAVPQAGLDVAASLIPFGGRLVQKLTGIPMGALLGRSAESAAKLADERLLMVLAKGTGVGALAEIPTEITQQMLERAQAGLSLSSPDALKEYGETAYQVGLLAPLGAVGRLSERSGARDVVAARQQEEAAQAAVAPGAVPSAAPAAPALGAPAPALGAPALAPVAPAPAPAAAVAPGAAAPVAPTPVAPAPVAPVAPALGAPVAPAPVAPAPLTKAQAAEGTVSAPAPFVIPAAAAAAAPERMEEIQSHIDAIMGSPEIAAEMVINNEQIPGLTPEENAFFLEMLQQRLAQEELAGEAAVPTGAEAAPAKKAKGKKAAAPVAPVAPAVEDTTVEPTEPRTLDQSFAAMQPAPTPDVPAGSQYLIPGAAPLKRTGAVQTKEQTQNIQTELKQLSKAYIAARQEGRRGDALAIIDRRRYLQEQGKAAEAGPVLKGVADTGQSEIIETGQVKSTSPRGLQQGIERVRNLPGLTEPQATLLDQIEANLPALRPYQGDVAEWLNSVRQGRAAPETAQYLQQQIAQIERQSQQQVSPRELQGMLVKLAKPELSNKERGLLRLVGENQSTIMADPAARMAVARWLASDVGQGIGEATQNLRKYFGVAEEAQAYESPVGKATAARAKDIAAEYADAARAMDALAIDIGAPLQPFANNIERMRVQLKRADSNVAAAQAAYDAPVKSRSVGQEVPAAMERARLVLKAGMDAARENYSGGEQKTRMDSAKKKYGETVAALQRQFAVAPAQSNADAKSKQVAKTQLDSAEQARAALKTRIDSAKKKYDADLAKLREQPENAEKLQQASKRFAEATKLKGLQDTINDSERARDQGEVRDSLNKLVPLKVLAETKTEAPAETETSEMQADMFPAERKQMVQQVPTVVKTYAEKQEESRKERKLVAQRKEKQDMYEDLFGEQNGDLSALPGIKISFEKRRAMLDAIDEAPAKRRAFEDAINDGKLSQEERDAAQTQLTAYLANLRKKAADKDESYATAYKLRGEESALVQLHKQVLEDTSLSAAKKAQRTAWLNMAQAKLNKRDVQLASLRGVAIDPIETSEERLETLEQLTRETYGQVVSEEEQAQLDKTKGRALGPVTRKAIQPMSVMRTGRPDQVGLLDKDKDTHTKPDMRVTEKRGVKQRNVEISKEEMEAANKLRQEKKAFVDERAQAQQLFEIAQKKVEDLSAKLANVKERVVGYARLDPVRRDLEVADRLAAEQESIADELAGAKADLALLAPKTDAVSRQSEGEMYGGESRDESENTSLVNQQTEGKASFEGRLLSRGKPTTASTIESVTAELAEAGIVIPKQKTHTTAQPAKLTVFESVDNFTKAYPTTKGKVPSDAKGLVYKGQAFLFADNIGKGEALGVTLHEVGAHIGFRNFFNPAQYNAIATTVKNWAKRNDGSVESKIGKAALARVEAAETTADQVNDEIIAYAVEEAIKAGIQPTAAVNRTAAHNWLKMVVDAFKKALAAFGINPSGLKAGDLVNFAYGCAQLELQGTWHGSDAKFTAFDTAFAGEGEGAFDRRFEREKSLGVGPYVTADKDYAEYYQTAVTFGKASNATGYGNMAYQQFRDLDDKFLQSTVKDLSPSELRTRYESNLLTRYLRGVQEGEALDPEKNKTAVDYIADKKAELERELADEATRLKELKAMQSFRLQHSGSRIGNAVTADMVLALEKRLVDTQARLDAVNALDVSKIKGLKERPKQGNLYRTLDDVPDERVYQVNSSFTVGDRPKLDALLKQYGDQYAKQLANKDGTYPANGLFFDMREKLGVDETAQVLKAAGIDAIEQNNEGGAYVERAFIGVKPEILGTNLQPIGQAKGPLFSRTLLGPKEVKYANPGLAEAGAIVDKVVAKDRGAIDRIRAAAGGFLGLETQLVDRFAPLDRISKGMEALKGSQMMYYLRMYDQRMNYTAQSVANGAIQRVAKKRPDGRTEYVVESVDGANIKQVVDILKKAPAGSPDAANRLFTMYLAGLRAKNKGFDTLHFGKELTEAQLDITMARIRATPGLEENFKQAREVYNEYNRNMVGFLAQSGAISKDHAARLTKENDYIPFYREEGGVAELLIGGESPIRIGSVADQPYLHELVGGDRPILDFLTSSVQNTALITDMGLRNLATKNSMNELEDMGLAQIRPGPGTANPKIVRFKVDGDDYHAIVDTDAKTGIPADLLVKGMQGIPTQLPVLVRALGIPATILRRAVTLSPTYAARQLFRDSIAATLLSGADIAPVLGALKELGKSATKSTLEKRGITGGQVFAGGSSSEAMTKILNDMLSGKGNLGSLIAKAEALNMEADAATRRAQYNSYIKQGLSEMEATLMSLESMNFTKRGASPSIHMANALIPFFNSQIQGLNVLYKALTGKLPFDKRLKIQEKLITRGALMFGASLAYAAMMQDDEAYKNATPEQKYGNWFIRIAGIDEPIKVPIPFEVGYLFKALPEAIYNSLANEHGSEEAFKALKTIVLQTIPGGTSMATVPYKGINIPITPPIPQALKPGIEAALGKSFYTGRDTLSRREQAVLPEQQFREGSSEISKMMGAGLGLSPIKIEALVSGYTGTMGLALMQVLSMGVPTGESPEKTTKRLSDMPVFGSSFQPNDAGGIINAVYERMDDIKKVKTTVDRMLSEGRVAEAKELAIKRAEEFAQSGVADYFTSHMQQITKFENAIRASNLTGDEKRAKLDETRQMKIRLAEMVRKATDEAKSID